MRQVPEHHVVSAQSVYSWLGDIESGKVRWTDIPVWTPAWEAEFIEWQVPSKHLSIGVIHCGVDLREEYSKISYLSLIKTAPGIDSSQVAELVKGAAWYCTASIIFEYGNRRVMIGEVNYAVLPNGRKVDGFYSVSLSDSAENMIQSVMPIVGLTHNFMVGHQVERDLTKPPPKLAAKHAKRGHSSTPYWTFALPEVNSPLAWLRSNKTNLNTEPLGPFSELAEANLVGTSIIER